jgi:peptidoglycan/LPS O-acetylase OafA/YrhL
MPSTQVDRARVEALTGLRFLAAALVVVHHAVRHFRPGLIPTGDGLPGLLARALYDVLYEGNQAVSFFFVLSGVVLAYTYLDERGGLRGTRGGYYLARVARVYPTYLVGFIIAAPFGVAEVLANGFSLPDVMLSAVLLAQGWPQLWMPNITFLWNGPAWSLSVEAFFYLAFPLILPLFGRIKTRLLSATLIATLALAQLLPYIARTTWCGPLTAQTCDDLISTLPVMRLPEFLVGIVLGVALVKRPAWMTAAMRTPRVLAFELTVLALIFIREIPGIDNGPGGLGLFWVLLVVSCATSTGLLASRPFRVLGEASYGIYLLHWPLWNWYTTLLSVPEREPSQGWSSIVLVAGYVVLVATVALLNLRYVEQPGRRFLRRLHARPPTRSGAVVIQTPVPTTAA